MSSRRVGLRKRANENQQDDFDSPVTDSLTPGPNPKLTVCNAVKAHKKLWKSSLVASKADIAQTWLKVAARTGFTADECKKEYAKVKKSLKRRITDAINKGNAASWPEVHKYVASCRINRNPEIWVKLPWLAKQFAEETFARNGTRLQRQYNLVDPQSADFEQPNCYFENSSSDVIGENASLESVDSFLNELSCDATPMGSSRSRRKRTSNTSKAQKKKKLDHVAEFHVVPAAVACGSHIINSELPTTMIDIKTEEEILEQQEAWRNAGPPGAIGNEGTNGASSSSSSNQASQSCFEGQQQQAFGVDFVKALMETFFIDNFGNMEAETAEKVLKIVCRSVM